MIEWFLSIIGVGEEFTAHLDQASLHVQRPLLLWLGLALTVPAAWYIYARQRSHLSTVPAALMRGLTATRVLILVILVFVLAGPYLRLDQRIENKPIVALVFDHSQSMDLPAGPFETDAVMLQAAQAAGYQAADGKLDAETRKLLNRLGRAAFARQAVESSADKWLKPLTKDYDVRFYSLAGELTPMSVAPEALTGKQSGLELPETAADGPETHLGDGIARLVEEAAGRTIAGVVLFSDGQNTGGVSPMEAARAAAEVKAPILAVPAGSASPVRDVAIVDVFAPDLVSVGDTVHVSVALEIQGYAEQPVKVVLYEGAAAKPQLQAGQESPAALDSKDLVLRSTEQQHVDLSFEASAPGARTLSVEVQPVGELPEDLSANNADSVVVRVSDEKLRVLYVEGLPRWDFRFLKNAMRRDHGLAGGTKGGATVSAATPPADAATPAAATGSAPETPSAGSPGAASGSAAETPDIVLEAEVRRRPPDQQAVLPQTLDELAGYHTVILGDVSPRLVDSKFVELLAQAVRERGLGLVVAAGPVSMPHAYDERLAELLPVRLRKGAGGMDAAAYKPFRLEISPDGAIHEAMRLYDEAGRNDNIWAQMPPFFWCAAVERPSPGATVLAHNSAVRGRYGKLPLVAHHYAGQGKVLFVGTDSTWLWRQNVGDRFFYKFWGQAIRFVARRDADDVRKKSWVEVRPPRARPGEQAQIELMAFAADGSPRREPTVPLRVLGGEEGPGVVEMTADQGMSGRYVGKFTARRTGQYRFVFEPGGALPPIEALMHVAPATEELRRPNVNLQALAQLGTLVEISELETIPERLQGEPRLTELHREASIWDNWLTLTLLVFIYSLDVGLRRLAGLS